MIRKLGKGVLVLTSLAASFYGGIALAIHTEDRAHRKSGKCPYFDPHSKFYIHRNRR